MPGNDEWYLRLVPSKDNREAPLKEYPLVQLLIDEHHRSDSPDSRRDRFVPGGIVLGRRSGITVEDRTSRAFSSPVVSRNHAQLTATPQGDVYITDLDSLHGTHLKGPFEDSRRLIRLEPWTPTQLLHGDTLILGKVVHSDKANYEPLTLSIEYRYPQPGKGSSYGTRTVLSNLTSDLARSKFATIQNMPQINQASPQEGSSDVIVSNPQSKDAQSFFSLNPGEGSTISGGADFDDLGHTSSRRTGTYGVPSSLLYESDNEEDLPRGSDTESRHGSRDSTDRSVTGSPHYSPLPPQGDIEEPSSPLEYSPMMSFPETILAPSLIGIDTQLQVQAEQTKSLMADPDRNYTPVLKSPPNPPRDAPSRDGKSAENEKRSVDPWVEGHHPEPGNQSAPGPITSTFKEYQGTPAGISAQDIYYPHSESEDDLYEEDDELAQPLGVEFQPGDAGLSSSGQFVSESFAVKATLQRDILVDESHPAHGYDEDHFLEDGYDEDDDYEEDGEILYGREQTSADLAGSEFLPSITIPVTHNNERARDPDYGRWYSYSSDQEEEGNSQRCRRKDAIEQDDGGSIVDEESCSDEYGSQGEDLTGMSDDDVEADEEEVESESSVDEEPEVLPVKPLSKPASSEQSPSAEVKQELAKDDDFERLRSQFLHAPLSSVESVAKREGRLRVNHLTQLLASEPLNHSDHRNAEEEASDGSPSTYLFQLNAISNLPYVRLPGTEDNFQEGGEEDDGSASDSEIDEDGDEDYDDGSDGDNLGSEREHAELEDEEMEADEKVMPDSHDPNELNIPDLPMWIVDGDDHGDQQERIEGDHPRVAHDTLAEKLSTDISHDNTRPRTPSLSSCADSSPSIGLITPPSDAKSPKRERPAEFDEDSIPAKVLKVDNDLRETKQGGLARTIGLVVLGAAIGSVGTIAGLMQIAD